MKNSKTRKFVIHYFSTTVFTRKQSADFFFFSPKNCGLHSSADYIRVRISFFFFFRLEKNVYSSITKRSLFSKWWLSAKINWLSAVVKASKYSKSLSQNSDTPANAVNICKIHKIFSDNNRVRIKIECGLNSFFLPKIADYNRVRIIIECGSFSS